MSTRVCGRCRRPLPAPAEGGAPAPCPFCAAQDAGRAGAGRAAQSRPPADVGASKKRAEAFASALSENAGRTTPVHSFAVPPEAIPVSPARRREAPPAPTPPPVVLAPPPAPVITILPPAAAPQPPPAPPPRRAAAVTATLASLGPGPLTPQSRSPPAAPAAVAAPAVAAAPAAALAAVSVVAPSVTPAPAAAPAPHLVPVPTPSPAPIAAAPAAAAGAAPAPVAAPARKAMAAASLAETMLAFSPAPDESQYTPEPREAPPAQVVYEAPRAAAPAPAPASPPAERGADAWNISSYLDGAKAPPAPIAALEPPPEADTVTGFQLPQNEPVEPQIRGGLSAFLRRLPARGIGLAAVAALVVLAIGAGAFLLLGGPKRPATTASAVNPTKAPMPPAPAPRVAAVPRVVAAPAAPARPPAMVVRPTAEPPAAEPATRAPKVQTIAEKIEKKTEKPAKVHAPEPEAAPPPVEAEPPRAAPSRHHAHTEAKSKAVSKHARHASASSKRGGGHRRTVARASAAAEPGTPTSATDDSDKMARVRDAYREGNERLFKGDAAGAITAYEEMVRLNPKDPAGYRGLGLASAQLGKRTEAVRYLRAYLKHAPNADDRGIIISRISLLQTLPAQ
jgi:hypothetical protein